MKDCRQQGGMKRKRNVEDHKSHVQFVTVSGVWRARYPRWGVLLQDGVLHRMDVVLRQEDVLPRKGATREGCRVTLQGRVGQGYPTLHLA